MTYLFENLNDESFQRLVQALLVKEYPDLQCFPVGQPDGGRDLSSRFGNDVPNVVGQVKFKRKDESDDNADWMISALEKELPKVKRLVDAGMKQYLMITNAEGTAHPEVGRIDRVQQWLDDNVPVPAMCLWRDDLTARLDGHADVKLSYPALLTGEDTILLIVKAMMGPQKERISRTLRGFVAAQYLKDEEVKFRQVELANSLLALFVDVPVKLGPLLWGTPGRHFDRRTQIALRTMAKHDYTISALDEDHEYFGPPLVAGTADLLLNADIQESMPWIVLQGGPGQGKSTLAQYVCQVHRARYLGKAEFVDQLPDTHLATAFRVPIKVDLRDLASFLDGQEYLGQAAYQNHASASLETFLASLVSAQSGGHSFTVDDLAETATSVPLLLFFDGLDEVADLKLRRLLVDRVGEGLNRLKETGADIQVVITSRPSLFGRAPSFPKAFMRLSLAPIGDPTINEYADKWVVARRLDPDRAAEVKEILTAKLELGHIRELTRNPMQLTILLSLIHSIGYSLPDLRTDLYREYVNLFMTREAEKSAVVREHRALLLAIVEFLAWTLQAGAESDRKAGSISGEEVRMIIGEFLDREEQDHAILDDLFAGTMERVYVLVQRVEGLYEFEVQPLREYFAAKYLYSSAPVGNFRHQVVQGDRAQRFEAIAANPYWSNVVRFYAGFYEGGELGALESSLRQLLRSKSFALSLTTRGIGAALLADWVFRSKRPIQNEIIDLVFDPVGVHLAALARLPGFTGALDVQCGRDRLASIIFEQHIAPIEQSANAMICSLLRRNGGSSFGDQFAALVRAESGDSRTTRIRQAVISGGLRKATEEILDELFYGDDPTPGQERDRLTTLIANDSELAKSSSRIMTRSIAVLLGWGGFETAANTPLAQFASILSGTGFPTAHVDPTDDVPDTPIDRVVRKVTAMFEKVRHRSAYADVEIWSEMIESVRAEFSDTWSTYRLVLYFAGVIKVDPALIEGLNLGDQAFPLLSRAAAARAWSGRAAWWTERLTAATDDRLFWLAMVLAWGRSRHVSTNLALITEIVEGLDSDDFERLVDSMSMAHSARRSRGGRSRAGVAIPDDASPRLVQVMFSAFGKAELPLLAKVTLPDEVRDEIERDELTAELSQFPGWGGLSARRRNHWLTRFAEAQSLHAHLDENTRYHLVESGTLPDSVSEEVIRSARDYPREVVIAASNALQIGYSPKPVRAIAQAQSWQFE